MKEYVRLVIDVTAYYSGNTYYEEVFLPKSVWEEIKDGFQMYTYICELDGKHSEVKAVIEVDDWNEKQLETYQGQIEDGEDLFYHIYEYLDEEKYDRDYLSNVQEEVSSLSQVESMVIKFRKQDKETIENLLKNYLI